jgi:hypothetical protein
MRMPAKMLIVLALTSGCAGNSARPLKKKDKAAKPREEITRNVLTVLWREPDNIYARNLYFGPGGKEHEPHGPYTFIKEDLEGSNPKFNIRDRDGVVWKVKLGAEAKPETAATRLVWAAGYFTNEDYFLPVLHVDDMPSHLERKHAVKFIEPDGSMRNVRLKREPKDEKKVAIWHWRSDPFSGTRELSGLKVMMALINNWDLKSANNSIYQIKGDHPEQHYVVSDVGGSLGPSDINYGERGDVKAYSRSKWIGNTSPQFVSFRLMDRFSGDRWVIQNIPIADAKWIGRLFAQLSPDQIRDAFRAAGYSPAEMEGFAETIRRRIAELESLH